MSLCRAAVRLPPPAQSLTTKDLRQRGRIVGGVAISASLCVALLEQQCEVLSDWRGEGGVNRA